MDDQNLEPSFRPSNLHTSYSFSFRSDESDEEEEEEEDTSKLGARNLSYDDSTSNYQKTPRIFDRFYDSSSEEDVDNDTSSNYQRRLDYMLQFLDRKLSNTSSPSPGQPLPEFCGSGGGTGIFRPPVRAPVHPNRPPSLELRPHLLRETQVGRFLRKVVCVSDGVGPQLWAGSESGLRVWDLKSDIYGGGCEEEEGTARYKETGEVASATLCLVGDGGNGVVWSGHKDGRIRCWKMMDGRGGDGGGKRKEGFEEVLSWHAHFGPVLSMVMSAYGDLWSGSEGGAVRIWPWEAIEKSLSLRTGERHMAALIVERSYIDLRNQVNLNGACSNIFTSDIRYMLSDHAGAKVWSASYQSFALW